jgi:hypothetical protein
MSRAANSSAEYIALQKNETEEVFNRAPTGGGTGSWA